MWFLDLSIIMRTLPFIMKDWWIFGNDAEMPHQTTKHNLLFYLLLTLPHTTRTIIILPPVRNYIPIEDALPLRDQETLHTCAGKPCRSGTFSTRPVWLIFVWPSSFIYCYLEEHEKKHSRN
jgi:hypothetical protein